MQSEIHRQGLNIVETQCVSSYVFILFPSIDWFFSLLHLDYPMGKDHMLSSLCTESSLHVVDWHVFSLLPPFSHFPDFLFIGFRIETGSLWSSHLNFGPKWVIHFSSHSFALGLPGEGSCRFCRKNGEMKQAKPPAPWRLSLFSALAECF